MNVAVKVVGLGEGSYSLSWVVPEGAQSYRIKLSDKQIVEWLNFNPTTNTFGLDPNANVPWFAATNVTSAPPPGAPGSVQTFTIGGLDPTKTYHFAMKAYISSPITGGK